MLDRIREPLNIAIRKHPAIVSIGSGLLGFSLAVWLIPSNTIRSSLPGLKEGIFVSFPTAKLRDPMNDLLLKGSKVLLVRHSLEASASPPCKISHKPLTLSANDRTTLLVGNLSDFESFVLQTSLSDFQKPDFASVSDNSIPKCDFKTKVTYGEEK